MKFKFKPFYVFHTNGNMYKCDKNGEVEVKKDDTDEVKKLKSDFDKKDKKQEKKDAKL